MSPLKYDHSSDAAIAAMARLPHAGVADVPAGTGKGDPDAVGPGTSSYHHGRGTLPIRVELLRQWHRKRTQFALGFMVLLPLILAGAFALGDDDASRSATSFIDLAQSSAANFTLVTLFFSSSFLLIVLISLFFGDTVASEASWSSLKYLLAIPVPRRRLLRQKLVVAAILSVVSIAVLVLASGLIGLALYGSGPLTTPTGAHVEGFDVVVRITLVGGYLLLALAWVAGAAFLMTVSTDVPLGAVGTAVLLSIVSRILDQIDALGDLRHWLPTHYSFAWTDALVTPIGWDAMARGGCTSLAYAAVLVAIAYAVFRRKDITS